MGLQNILWKTKTNRHEKYFNWNHSNYTK